MKIRNFIALILLFFCLSNINAQIGLKSIGAGLSIGSESRIGGDLGLGLNGNILIKITDEIDAEAQGIIYFPSSSAYTDMLFISLNGNGHYNFFDEDKFTGYGLAGLNLSYLHFSTDIPYLGESSTSDTYLGLNIGVGGNYQVTDKIDLFGQLGYTLSDADQLFINGGLAYKF